MTPREEYDAIEKEIDDLRDIQKKMIAAELQRLSGGLKEGDLLRETAGCMRLGAFRSFYDTFVWPHGSVWVKVALLKKDGTTGNRVVIFFHWKHEE